MITLLAVLTISAPPPLATAEPELPPIKVFTYAEATELVKKTRGEIVVFFCTSDDVDCPPGSARMRIDQQPKDFQKWWKYDGDPFVATLLWRNGRVEKERHDPPKKPQVAWKLSRPPPHTPVIEQGSFTVWTHLLDYRHRFPRDKVTRLTRQQASLIHDLDHAGRRSEALALLESIETKPERPPAAATTIQAFSDDCPDGT